MGTPCPWLPVGSSQGVAGGDFDLVSGLALFSKLVILDVKQLLLPSTVFSCFFTGSGAVLVFLFIVFLCFSFYVVLLLFTSFCCCLMFF